MKLGEQTPAIITGGASGLGAAVATALRAEGVPVGILDMNADTGAEFARDIGASFAQCDISDPAAVTPALDSLRDRQGQERLCVNCAGIAPAAKSRSSAPPRRVKGGKVGLFSTTDPACRSCAAP